MNLNISVKPNLIQAFDKVITAGFTYNNYQKSSPRKNFATPKPLTSKELREWIYPTHFLLFHLRPRHLLFDKQQLLCPSRSLQESRRSGSGHDLVHPGGWILPKLFYLHLGLRCKQMHCVNIFSGKQAIKNETLTWCTANSRMALTEECLLSFESNSDLMIQNVFSVNKVISKTPTFTYITFISNFLHFLLNFWNSVETLIFSMRNCICTKEEFLVNVLRFAIAENILVNWDKPKQIWKLGFW